MPDAESGSTTPGEARFHRSPTPLRSRHRPRDPAIPRSRPPRNHAGRSLQLRQSSSHPLPEWPIPSAWPTGMWGSRLRPAALLPVSRRGYHDRRPWPVLRRISPWGRQTALLPSATRGAVRWKWHGCGSTAGSGCETTWTELPLRVCHKLSLLGDRWNEPVDDRRPLMMISHPRKKPHRSGFFGLLHARYLPHNKFKIRC